MQLDQLVNVTTVASAVISAGVGFLSGYLSVRLTLNDHGNRLDNLDRAVAGGRDALKEHQEDGHKKQFDVMRDELLNAERKMNERLAAIESHRPNCPAHQAEFNGKLEALEARMQMSMMKKLLDIAEQNASFREDLRQRFLTDTQTITREMVSSDGVSVIVEGAMQELRKNELRDIYKRLSELEKQA